MTFAVSWFGSILSVIGWCWRPIFEFSVTWTFIVTSDFSQPDLFKSRINSEVSLETCEDNGQK